MQLHNLKRKTQNKKSRLVGRGGKRGKTAGRGTKGQKARSGRKLRPEMRDIIKKLPKLRGYSFNTIETKPLIIKISVLEKNVSDNDVVNVAFLIEKKLVKLLKGKNPKVKILGDKKDSVFSKKIVLEGIKVSSAIKSLIEKAGGEVK